MPYKDLEKRRECNLRNMHRWIERNPEEHRKRSRESMRKYYKEHPEVVVEQNAKTKIRYRKWWNEIKSELSCIKCGENHTACLEFHHRDPSTKENGQESNISRLTGGGWMSKEKVLREMEKCDVLCANCHRKVHYESRGGFTLEVIPEKKSA